MYIDGMLIPVPVARRDEYLDLAHRMAAIFKAHGATRVVECWGDDISPGEVTSFPLAVKLEEGETVVMSWIEYPDKATRDKAATTIMDAPEMQAAMQSMPFDGKRMIFGGFSAILDE